MSDSNGNDPEYAEGNDAEYEVGYGKPPRKNQFPKGKSGNPKGRPKGAKDLKTELAEELNEWVTITENGKTRRVRKRRVILKALAAKAAKGDVKAADKIIDLNIMMFGFEDERREQQKLTSNDSAILEQLLGGGSLPGAADNESSQKTENRDKK